MDEAQAWSNIVVGTDGSPGATKALQQAVGLAAATGAVLHVVSVVKPAASLVAGDVGIAAVYPEIERASREAANDALAGATAAAEAAGIVMKAHVCMGDPADVLVDVATDIDADVVVVGSRGMTGVRRVLGSVPNSVSHHAPCSVLIVKTD